MKKVLSLATILAIMSTLAFALTASATNHTITQPLTFSAGVDASCEDIGHDHGSEPKCYVWEGRGNILTLTNFNLAVNLDDETPAILFNHSSDIILNGVNTITNKNLIENGLDTFGIKTNASLYIYGDGTLNIETSSIGSQASAILADSEFIMTSGTLNIITDVAESSIYSPHQSVGIMSHYIIIEDCTINNTNSKWS